MRIAYVITRSDEIGGAQIHVRDLASALSDLGHEPAVFAGSDGILADELRTRGIPFVPLCHLGRSVSPTRDLRALIELRRKLRDYRPDVISTHCSKAGLLGRLAGRSLGVPTLFTAHGWRFPLYTRSFQRWVTRGAERVVGPISTKIVTVCESDRELAIRERIAPPDRFVTIRNAMPDVGHELRARPGQEANPVRLAMVARFVVQKDHPSLLHALARLLDLDWRLDLIGSGSLEPKVRRLAESLGLADRISFMGFQRDVSRLLAASHAFVLASRWEGFPRSILEAMRAGLPVVASDVGGVSEAVTDGETGFLVPPQSSDALESRLRELLSSSKLRCTMGTAARRAYEQTFAFPALVRSTVALYEDVLGGDRRALGPMESQ